MSFQLDILLKINNSLLEIFYLLKAIIFILQIGWERTSLSFL
jgi:hypothetical protein